MGLNKTQCPHCFTTYVISDEQFRVSEGMVRCGTCRERFQARLIGATPGSPRFDPRDTFIEPLSEDPAPTTPAPAPQITKIEFTNPPSVPIQGSTGFSRYSLEDSLNSEVSIDLSDDEVASDVAQSEVTDADSQPVSESVDSPSVAVVLAGIEAQRKRKSRDQNTKSTTSESEKPTTQNKTYDETEAKQAELELPLRDSAHTAKTSSPQRDDPIDSAVKQDGEAPEFFTAQDEAQLIDQVDHLIQDKIFAPKPSDTRSQKAKRITTPTPEVNTSVTRTPQSRAKSRSKSPVFKWLGVLFSCLLAGVLSALFVYQLWLRQWVQFDEVGRFENTMHRVIEPIADRLATHNIELPVRRNLNDLELVSARTETHPTRPSTTLLRVSLINQADIAQPLPWLELSLRDSEGQLVSRRKLPPRDYLYNNKTTASIGPNELKKVTIELLAFPKQVTGYELKIINR